MVRELRDEMEWYQDRVNQRLGTRWDAWRCLWCSTERATALPQHRRMACERSLDPTRPKLRADGIASHRRTASTALHCNPAHTTHRSPDALVVAMSGCLLLSLLESVQGRVTVWPGLSMAGTILRLLPIKYITHDGHAARDTFCTEGVLHGLCIDAALCCAWFG